MKFRSTPSASSLAALSQSTRWAASEMSAFHPLRAFLPGPNDDCCGSRAAVASRLMAQPVYPQLRKYPCVPALTLRAKGGLKQQAGCSFPFYRHNRQH